MCIPKQHSACQVSNKNIKVLPTPHTIKEENKKPLRIFIFYDLILSIKMLPTLMSVFVLREKETEISSTWERKRLIQNRDQTTSLSTLYYSVDNATKSVLDRPDSLFVRGNTQAFSDARTSCCHWAALNWQLWLSIREYLSPSTHSSQFKGNSCPYRCNAAVGSHSLWRATAAKSFL